MTITLLDLLATVLCLGGLVVCYLGIFLFLISSVRGQKFAAGVIFFLGAVVIASSSLYIILG